MLEVRGNEVNLEPDDSGVHGSGLYEHQQQSGNIGVVASPPTPPLSLMPWCHGDTPWTPINDEETYGS